MPIHSGQPAPADGVFLTTEKAMDITQKCKLAEIERDELRSTLEAQPAYSMGVTWLVLSFMAGVVAGGAVVLVSK